MGEENPITINSNEIQLTKDNRIERFVNIINLCRYMLGDHVTMSVLQYCLLRKEKLLLNRFWQAMLCFHLIMMAIGRVATEKPGMRPLNLSKNTHTHTESSCFHIPLCHVVQRLHREVHPSLNHLHCIKTQSAFALKDCAIWASGSSQEVTSGGGFGTVKCSAMVC